MFTNLILLPNCDVVRDCHCLDPILHHDVLFDLEACFLLLFGNGNCHHGVGHIKFVIIIMVNIVVFYSMSCYWSSSWL